MKKVILNSLVVFFSTGLASAQFYYPGSNEPLPCIQGELTCAIIYGMQGYTVPFDNPNGPAQSPETSIDLIDLSLED